MITYSPFYKTLVKNNMTQYKLIKEHLIPCGTIQRMRNNESITLKSIDHLCRILNFDITDIVKLI